jgi:hypothetical protein
MPLASHKLWEDVIVDDMEALAQRLRGRQGRQRSACRRDAGRDLGSLSEFLDRLPTERDDR